MKFNNFGYKRLRIPHHSLLDMIDLQIVIFKGFWGVCLSSNFMVVYKIHDAFPKHVRMLQVYIFCTWTGNQHMSLQCFIVNILCILTHFHIIFKVKLMTMVVTRPFFIYDGRLIIDDKGCYKTILYLWWRAYNCQKSFSVLGFLHKNG